MKLVFATNNSNKLSEIRSLVPDGIEILSLKEINCNEDLRNTVIRVLSKELQDRADLLTTMAQKTVRQRTALALLLLDDIYEGKPINLSRDDLANFVGTATETVIRLLREFKKDLIIETKGRRIMILQKSQLIEISELT